MIRHLLAVLSGLALFHLTLVGQLPCAPVTPAADSQVMGAMDMGSMDMESGQHATGHRTPTQPASQRCCEAMSGCSVTIAIAAATQVVGQVHDAGEMSSAEYVGLLSFQPAPEPPPPKT